MMRHKYSYIGVAFSMAVALLLTGCTSDAEDERPMRDLYLVLGTHTYSDISPLVTRLSLPTGYVTYDELTLKMATEKTKIRAFITQGNETKFQGDFTYKGNATWNNKVPIDEGDYYIYGFMPSSILSKVSMTVRSSDDYSNGAVMTISDLPAMTFVDPCVIVGVKGHDNSAAALADMNLQLGQFKYNAGDEGKYLYVLIDHLFAALEFNLCVDKTYNQLRTIKMTKLELEPIGGLKTVTLTATLTQGNNSSPLAVVYDENTTATMTWQPIYDGEEITLKDETESDYQYNFLAFVAPGENNKRFKMKTTYNVYDRKGNLIRENCTAENTLNIPTLTRGDKYIFNLKVTPTYLYVLSEPDLDNPTVTVN